MEKPNRKKEWVHLVLAILALVVVWLNKELVAIALCALFSVVVLLWLVAMWQAIAKGIPVKDVSLEETFKCWAIKIKEWFADLIKKPEKKREGDVVEYDVEDCKEQEEVEKVEEVSETVTEEEPQATNVNGFGN